MQEMNLNFNSDIVIKLSFDIKNEPIQNNVELLSNKKIKKEDIQNNVSPIKENKNNNITEEEIILAKDFSNLMSDTKNNNNDDLEKRPTLNAIVIGEKTILFNSKQNDVILNKNKKNGKKDIENISIKSNNLKSKINKKNLKKNNKKLKHNKNIVPIEINNEESFIDVDKID